MERYNYDLIRDRVVKMIPDGQWSRLPFDKDFLKQAICLGWPVSRLAVASPLRLDPPVFSVDWGKEILETLRMTGKTDVDKLDQAVILHSYDLADIDPLSTKKCEPTSHYVMVVHMRSAKMATLSGITLLSADRPPKVIASVDF